MCFNVRNVLTDVAILEQGYFFGTAGIDSIVH